MSLPGFQAAGPGATHAYSMAFRQCILFRRGTLKGLGQTNRGCSHARPEGDGAAIASPSLVPAAYPRPSSIPKSLTLLCARFFWFAPALPSVAETFEVSLPRQKTKKGRKGLFAFSQTSSVA